MFLLLLVLLVSSQAFAQYDDYSSPISVSVSGFSDSLSGSGGAEIALRIQPHPYISGGLAAVLYENDDYNDGTGVFGGYSASLFFSPNWLVQPYVGVGIFSGDREVCYEYYDRVYDECEDHYIFAVYPEAGIRFRILSTEVGLFKRRYFDSDERYSYIDMVGVNIGYRFDLGVSQRGFY